MSASEDRAGDAAKMRFLALLDEAAVKGRTLDFWWRDDDAENATPALDRLLALADRYALPLALAVVPKGATPALAERLGSEPRVAVLQHGWQHRNHAAAGEKKIELGGERPLTETLDELRRGRERLKSLFPRQFLPVLVPPWNRIAGPVRAALGDVGLPGLSTFGPAPAGDLHQVNVHLDIFEWRPVRRTDRAGGGLSAPLRGNRAPAGGRRRADRNHDAPSRARSGKLGAARRVLRRDRRTSGGAVAGRRDALRALSEP